MQDWAKQEGPLHVTAQTTVLYISCRVSPCSNKKQMNRFTHGKGMSTALAKLQQQLCCSIQVLRLDSKMRGGVADLKEALGG